MGELRHWSPGGSGGFEFLGGQLEVDEPDDTSEYEYTPDLHGDPGEGWEELSLHQIPEHEPIRSHYLGHL